jgi:hypothetical protein
VLSRVARMALLDDIRRVPETSLMSKEMVTVLTVTRRPHHIHRFIESVAAQDFDAIVRHVVVAGGDPRVRQSIDDEGPPYPLEVIFVPRPASDADGPARLAAAARHQLS